MGVLVALRTWKGLFNEQYEKVSSLEQQAGQREEEFSIRMFLFLGWSAIVVCVLFSGLKHSVPGVLILHPPRPSSQESTTRSPSA
jgi:hypothetical protein